jgi:hypothetical protein
MRRTWVLDTGTKGTGANMVPLENVLTKADAESEASRPVKRTRAPRASEPGQAAPPRRARKAKEPVRTTVNALPPGHVRKKTTGEIGKVRSVDPKAGTANVHWLKRGAASTVPLSAISRR